MVLALFGNLMATEGGRVAIFYEEANDTRIQTLVEDLREDLESVGYTPVKLYSKLESGKHFDIMFIVGSLDGCREVAGLLANGDLPAELATVGERGGVWGRFDREGTAIVTLAGADAVGTQYAVYDYAKEVLGIDPFAYWTGVQATRKSIEELLAFESRVIEAPLVPILCYFENDVDELMNMDKPLLEYSWEDYKEMIDSLVRIRFNAIQPFDMLGRAEFFMREEYLSLRPDYEVDYDLLEQMLEYAQAKGMQVIVDLSLGSKLRRITQEESDCWSDHKQSWIDAWRYLLEETPVGMADHYSLRPRHQIWDWPYRSSCGEDTVEVMNEVFAALGALLEETRPDALKVCVCYGDGMDMYNEGFRPPEDFLMVWSDDGWGDFEVYPESNDAYKFGTYMHAGFWLNHDVSDPYPHKVGRVMKKMFEKYDASEFLEVNGQTFRPFLINLEAYSEVARDPDSFDGDRFYQNWMGRYFEGRLVNVAIESMEGLHEAHFGNVGYVECLWEIKEALAYLSDSPLTRPRRAPITVGFDRVDDDIEDTRKRLRILEKAVNLSESGLSLDARNSDFFHDHIALPIAIFADLVRFEESLHKLAVLKYRAEDDAVQLDREHAIELLEETERLLSVVYDRRKRGDRNELWKGWYDPAKRRPNNGFPTQAMLEDVAAAVNATWKD